MKNNNYIHISKHKTNFGCKSILVKHDFFKSDVCFVLLKDKIIFTNPDIDSKKTNKVNVSKYGFSKFTIKADLPLGNFEICQEESNEDQLVIYL